MKTDSYQPPKDLQNEMPVWLKLLFIAGGAILLAYLLSELFNYLFPPDKKTKVRPRVFISHSWRNDDDYWNLINKFKINGFEFYNHSIEEKSKLDVNTAKQIERGIENKIKGCSKVLVLGGEYANRYWIKKEIEIAKRMRKEVIAIRPWKKAGIPKNLYNKADRVVGFNSKTIIENLKS